VEIYLRVWRAHYQDGLSGREIARQFGISRDSVQDADLFRASRVSQNGPSPRQTRRLLHRHLVGFYSAVDTRNRIIMTIHAIEVKRRLDYTWCLRTNTMNDSDVIKVIQSALRDVLVNEEVVITPETTASDVSGWDSLTNVRLFIAIEEKMSLRFSPMDLDRLTTVGDIVNMVQDKNSEH